MRMTQVGHTIGNRYPITIEAAGTHDNIFQNLDED